jgi:S1-C subfamily serine protease
MHLSRSTIRSAVSGRALPGVVLFSVVAMLLAWRLALAAPEPSSAENSALVEQRASSEFAEPRSDLDADERANIALFKRASPAVVHITNLGLYRQRFSLSATEVPQGTGSGFLWDERGNVVTNFHVINKGEKFRVTLSDRSEWDASVVGAAPNHDLAVLHIDAPRERLSALAVGTSSGLAVGQKVFAIGNPFGLDQTLTTGHP